MIKKFKNSTSEHIDMKSLADKIQVAVARTGRFAFQDATARKEVAEEYEYQGLRFLSTRTWPRERVNSFGGDFVLTGEISSIVQEVGATNSCITR